MTSSIKRNPQFSKPNPDSKQSWVTKMFKFLDLANFSNATVSPDKAEVMQVDSNQSQEVKETRKNAKTTPVIGVIGAKGGVGSTTFAVNLAVSMVDNYSNALIIDTNLQQPDVALSLGLNPKYSLSDLISRRSRLDAKVLEACCEVLEFDSGALNIVSPPLELETSLSTELGLMTECMDKLKELTDIIILDLPKQLDQNLLSLLDVCDKIILVCEPSISSVTSAKRWISIFSDLDYSEQDLCLLINRTGKKQKQLEAEAINALKLKTNWHIPSSYSNLEQASLDGTPLIVSHPKDAYCKAVKPIADQLHDWFTEEKN